MPTDKISNDVLSRVLSSIFASLKAWWIGGSYAARRKSNTCGTTL